MTTLPRRLLHRPPEGRGDDPRRGPGLRRRVGRRAWNAHDLGRILAHYADDFEMTSPYIASLTGEPTGRLAGKEAVGAYWRAALERFPDVHFELVDVFLGA